MRHGESWTDGVLELKELRNVASLNISHGKKNERVRVRIVTFRL